METSESLHRPDWNPRKSKSAIGKITVANRVSESVRPVRLARRKAMIMPTERLMKTNGCPIHETHRAKRTVRLELDLVTIHLSLAACDNAPAHFTKADSIAVALAPAGDGQSVTVLDPFARFAIGQL